MDLPRQSLSERLSGLLAAIKNSKRAQSESNGSSSSKRPLEKMALKPEDVETLPDLLVFIKETSNPKVLRDVVARFLLNPLLSDNDRDLVKKKVREKVEEEKRKKNDLKKSSMESEASESSASSSQNSLEPSSACPTTSATTGNKVTPASSENPAEPSSDLPSIPSQSVYRGPLTEKLEKLNNLNSSSNCGTSDVEKATDDRTGKPESSIQFNEWVPWPAKKRSSSEADTARPQEQQGVPVNTSMYDRSASSVQPFSTDFSCIPAPSLVQIPPLGGSSTCQIPPPSFIPAPVVGNHAFAGFLTQEAPLNSVVTSRVFTERDRIPRTPTPSPPPPPRSPDPRIRAGAVVAAISDSGRLVMPGARAFKKSEPLPPMDDSAQRGRLSPPPHEWSPLPREWSPPPREWSPPQRERLSSPQRGPWSPSQRGRLSSPQRGPWSPSHRGSWSPSRRGPWSPPQHERLSPSQHGRLSPFHSTSWINCGSSNERVEKLDKSSSKSDARVYYIRQYALRHKVSTEEAERMIEQEEKEFEQSARKRRSRKRRSGGDTKGPADTKGHDDRQKERRGVYTKGFEPLPKQKYAKNIDDTEGMEDGEILDDSFDYGDAPLSKYPEFGPAERPRADFRDYERPPKIPSLIDMMKETSRNRWR